MEGAQPKIRNRLKAAIWGYLLLIIFEGALRKWFLPGLSNPLLIVRDPLAIYVLLVARSRGYLTFNGYSFWMIVIGIFGTITAVLVGHGNLFVALFGARIFLIHFPLMFSIGRIFTTQDVIKFGRVLLWISIPMTVLIILQFYSPQSAWVNRGVGGDVAGAGFSGANGFFRPPGTFSFTNGNSLYFGLVSSYVFYFWTSPAMINKILLIASTVCLLISIPFSISRTLLFETGLSIGFMVVALWNKPEYLKKVMLGAGIVFISFFILKSQSFFATGADAFSERFTTANEAEGGLNSVFMDRFLGGMIGAVQGAPDLPFFGYGLGMGTNAGSTLLTGGRAFLIAEQEWGRVIGELGLLMGFIVIIIRVSFSFTASRRGIIELRHNNPLPWMLLSTGFIQIIQGGWAQPTSLGFSIMSGGLILAAMNKQEFKIF